MAKFVLIGDLHFGEKGNSEKFNRHILDFLDWVCELKESHEVESVVQAGDWFHSRHKIDVMSLNYGIAGAKILNECFGKDNTFVLCGNHDTYNLNSLTINTVETLTPYVTTVYEPILVDSLLMTPWITDGEMWDNLVKNKWKAEYLIGHLEFNGFMVNDGYMMEHGLSHKELKKFKRVFSGHYHTPQMKDHVWYLGTPYPITMSEANQEHGVYIFDSDTGDVEFVVYEKIKVISIPYTDIDQYTELDPETTNIRIEFPDDLEDETLISECVDKLSSLKFTDVKVKYTPKKLKDLIDLDVEVEEVENIDKAVLTFLKSSTEVSGIDKELLGKMYQQAMEVETND